MELTFGEQIKIILKRKNMTIRQLAELIEVQTGRPMSRQNLTQKLNRDNFQEQDMKEIAQALGCLVQISVIDPMEATVASLQSMLPSGPVQREPEEADIAAAAGKTMRPAAGAGGGAMGGIDMRPAAGVDGGAMTGRNIQTAAGAGMGASVEANPASAGKASGAEGGADSAAAAGAEAETAGIDSDVLREIELALMESIQKEFSGGREEKEQKEPVRVNAKWQEEAYDGWSREQKELEASETEAEGKYEEETGAEETGNSGTEEPDKLSWAQKRPAIWPRLIVPTDTPAAPEEIHSEAETVRETEAAAEAEPEERPEVKEPAAAGELPFGDGDDLEDFEFFEIEELEGGDISGVSAPYTLKREAANGEEEAQPEEAAEEEAVSAADAEAGGRSEEAPIDYGSVSPIPGGDVSYVSAPYVIPRKESEEESPSGEIFVDEFPGALVDDSEDIVQEYAGEPQEPDPEEKLAAWDAAAKRRLGRSVFLSFEERKAKRAAREAEEARAKEEAAKAEKSAGHEPAIDPRTGLEYATNTVKHHPTKPDMLLVYDQEEHMWIEQAERAFHNFQIRKRAMLGKDYEPPVYLD